MVLDCYRPYDKRYNLENWLYFKGTKSNELYKIVQHCYCATGQN